jgi:hypothetical protein
MNDLDQFFGRPVAGIVGRCLGIHHMLADMTFDNLGDEAVEGAATGGSLLQDCRAARFFMKGSLDGIELAANAPNPVQQFFLVLESMSHFSLDPILEGSIQGPLMRAKKQFIRAHCVNFEGPNEPTT